ncbi:hypothetical protein NDI45_14700 [Leptolyngbya sp. GB1-A1]|uniref:hypothetical protein n=1 Tax=Leptolyngbya sp. GB1-A1 TaxID=2933908 RepID=UPI0032987046
MLRRFRRSLRQFLTRTRSINKQPLNTVSLIVIVLIDIFILVNVFTGLHDISRWTLNPDEAYPCYSEWRDYRTSTLDNKELDNKDFEKIRSITADENADPALVELPQSLSVQEQYQQINQGRLGSVSSTCLSFAELKDRIDNSENQQLTKAIDQKQSSIENLENSNRTIRTQYDSTLLEQIAGQNRNQSINAVGADRARAQLNKNNQQIAQLKGEIVKLKSQLVAKPESVEFLKFLRNDAAFNEADRGYQRASFWYPSIQLTFQALFLLPLLAGAGLVYRFAHRKRYGLVALISWHLLIIFFIPLILKIFQFLQVGALFSFLFDVISTIFGGLLFLISYAYILLIPIAGFVLIKFFQKIAVRTKLPPSSLVQQSRCLNCTRTLKHNEGYCPHCGYHQHLDCHNCHQPTYKHLPYCRNCGAEQDLGRSSSST